MMTVRDDRKIFSILSYIDWYLHEYNTTKHVAKIFALDIYNQLLMLFYVVKI